MNKERAYVQLISKLLGVEFDAIWQRHKRLLIQKAIAWAIGVIAVLAAIIGVWWNSQPVDVEVRINEASVHNDDLPALKDAIVMITLDNEKKADTIHSIDGFTTFKNIPHRHIGKSVRITIQSYDTHGVQSFLPLDTTLTLTKAISLDICRDEKAYGQVHLQFWNQRTEEYIKGIEVSVDDQQAVSDENGFAVFFIPLERQKTIYPVKSSVAIQDSIIQPWTEGCSIPTLIIKE